MNVGEGANDSVTRRERDGIDGCGGRRDTKVVLGRDWRITQADAMGEASLGGFFLGKFVNSHGSGSV
jgi:hypothetical protein